MASKHLHKAILLFVTTTLLLACGRTVDSYYDLKAGYKFHKGRVLYQGVKTWFRNDSIPFTVDSFTVVDTLKESRCYVITKNAQVLPPLLIPNRDVTDIQMVLDGKALKYGAADFDGNIVIFPQFIHWDYLGNGYVAVALYRNSHEVGVLHLRGEMITDLMYEEVSRDSVTGKILAKRFQVDAWVYDTLDISFLGSK